MRGRFLFQVILGVVLVGGIIALGGGLYQAGYVAGAAAQGAASGAVPPIAYGYGWGWHGGFGIFGFLGFFLFLFLLFGLFRVIAWGGRGWRGGPGGYGPRGPWGAGYGPDHDHPGRERWQAAGQAWFDDWHRRAHEAEPGSNPERPADAGTSGAAGR
jgi:hypothetical protein